MKFWLVFSSMLAFMLNYTFNSYNMAKPLLLVATGYCAYKTVTAEKKWQRVAALSVVSAVVFAAGVSGGQRIHKEKLMEALLVGQMVCLENEQLKALFLYLFNRPYIYIGFN